MSSVDTILYEDAALNYLWVHQSFSTYHTRHLGELLHFAIVVQFTLVPYALKTCISK